MPRLATGARGGLLLLEDVGGEPVLVDRLGGFWVPVVEEFGFGHREGAPTVPLGVGAEPGADTGTLTPDAPALV